MSAGSTLLVAVGATLVVLLLVDVFFTVFHPQARGGPINKLQNRLLWQLFGGVASLFPDGRRTARDHVLGLAAPTFAVGTILVWLLVLTAGTTLIYRPVITNFHVSPGSLGPPWIETLYYSVYVTSTLGLGDLVPADPLYRLLTVIHAVLGFMIFSVSLTYVLSVYRAASQRTALANDIAQMIEEPLCDWKPDVESLEWSSRWASSFSQRLSLVNAAHEQYPILHYFRPASPSDSLPLQLGTLVSWVSRLEEIDGDTHSRLWQSFSPFLSLRNAVDIYLDETTSHVVPPSMEGPDGLDPESREYAHARLLRFMCYDRSAGSG